MLEITTPPRCTAEREYVLGVIVEDWLALSYNLRQADVAAVTVRVADQPGEVCLPDTFFSQFVEGPGRWLEEASMPSRPLQWWDSRALAVEITLVDPVLPVIFGEPIAGDAVAPSPNQSADSPEPIIRLPIDIFGSAFFMLSRYEEVVRPDRDEHDRFPAWASLASQEGFLDRPIVDEYVEILWAAMERLWPRLVRRRPEPRTHVTCDVDNPFCFDGSFHKTVRRVGGDLLKRRSTGNAARTVVGNWFARKGDYRLDPHRNGLEYIMDLNEQAGRSVAFYFIAEKTDPCLDKPVSLDDPRMRQLLREIHVRGHEIGLHPGYHTFRHPDAMSRSATTLRRVMAEEGIEQDLIGGRQHFLRWETPTTPRLWDENSLDYDSTLGYADRPGFRCGTAREYLLYDLEKGGALRVRERPLIVMECSVIAKRYMALGYSDDALALMEYCRDICHRLGGDFTLLWHNSHLDSAADRRFYRRLVG